MTEANQNPPKRRRKKAGTSSEPALAKTNYQLDFLKEQEKELQQELDVENEKFSNEAASVEAISRYTKKIRELSQVKDAIKQAEQIKQLKMQGLQMEISNLRQVSTQPLPDISGILSVSSPEMRSPAPIQYQPLPQPIPQTLPQESAISVQYSPHRIEPSQQKFTWFHWAAIGVLSLATFGGLAKSFEAKLSSPDSDRKPQKIRVNNSSYLPNDDFNRE